MIIKTDRSEINNYLLDASNFHGNCDAVYIPASYEEAAEIMKECNSNNIPVSVRGAGTGLTGAAVPNGGVVISTEKLNKILNVSKERYTAVVEGGLILQDFHEVIDNIGLFYPPDPTEQNCTIGGNIATNASGAKTFKYGPTRDYVERIKVLLSDGEILDLRRGDCLSEDGILILNSVGGKSYKIPIEDINMPVVKNAAGYFIKNEMDAVDLFIGSEGTLGIILEAELRLLKRPENFLSFIAFFSGEKDALRFVATARDKSKSVVYPEIDALGIEFFDKNAVNFLREDYNAVPAGEYCAVWVEQDTGEAGYEIILDAWNKMIEDSGANSSKVWFAFDTSERKKLHEFRHAVSTKVNEFISRKGIVKKGTDLAVPDDKFDDFYYLCTRTVQSNLIPFVTYGHFGNSHIHLNMLPADKESVEKAGEIYRMLCGEAVKAGGTISAEHGIGKIKKTYFRMMYNDDEIQIMKNVKSVLDPGNILSPGNIFD